MILGFDCSVSCGDISEESLGGGSTGAEECNIRIPMYYFLVVIYHNDKNRDIEFVKQKPLEKRADLCGTLTAWAVFKFSLHIQYICSYIL